MHNGNKNKWKVNIFVKWRIVCNASEQICKNGGKLDHFIDLFFFKHYATIGWFKWFLVVCFNRFGWKSSYMKWLKNRACEPQIISSNPEINILKSHFIKSKIAYFSLHVFDLIYTSYISCNLSLSSNFLLIWQTFSRFSEPP